MCFRFRSFPFQSASFRPLFFRFWLLSLCFFLSSFFPPPPHSGFLGAPLPLSLLWLSPFFPTWFPVSSLPVLRTRLSVCFLSSFPVSLPQPFHRCFPSFPLSLVRFFFGLFCLLSAFFRPPQPASDYSAFCSFFSLLPVLPWQRFLRCFFPLPSGLFPCLPSDSGTQLPAVPFSVRCLASQWLPQRLSLLPCGSRPPPLCFRFRFRLLGSSAPASAARTRLY